MPSDPSPIRVAIADDHPIFRDGLRKLLEAEPGFAVVGEAGDGEDAVEMARRVRPDILLLDLAMPRMTGLDALRELGSESSTIRTILLTAAIEKAEIVSALQLGASGVLLKDSATRLLYKCIRSVMAGEFWVGRESVSDLVQVLRRITRSTDAQPPPRAGLTPRELEIIQEIVEGATNKDIAARFHLSEQTVKNHLSNIFDKLGVSSRLELALYAVNHRLLPGLTPGA